MSNRRQRRANRQFVKGVNSAPVQMELPLEFMGRDSSRGATKTDIDAWVRVMNSGKVAITFYNSIYEKIGEYVVMAEHEGRVYFAENRENGYHIKPYKDSDQAAITIQAECPCGKLLKKYIGRYRMEFDSKRGYCYIDKEHELNELNFVGKGATA